MEKLNQILKDLYRYYCVGIPQFASQYAGYKEIDGIVRNKINEIVEEKETNWSKLVASVRDYTNNNSILDMGYIQFPSYILRFPIADNIFSFGNRKNTLCLSVSLLTPFFTVYIEEEYKRLDSIAAINDMEAYDRFYLTHKHYDDPFFSDILIALTKIISNTFPGYQFIAHTKLFNHKITGVQPWPDFGSEYEHKNVSLYRLLFDGLTPMNTVTILK